MISRDQVSEFFDWVEGLERAVHMARRLAQAVEPNYRRNESPVRAMIEEFFAQLEAIERLQTSAAPTTEEEET